MVEAALYVREPGSFECAAHAELFRELPDEELVYYAHTYGVAAGQLDAAEVRRGLVARRFHRIAYRLL